MHAWGYRDPYILFVKTPYQPFSYEPGSAFHRSGERNVHWKVEGRGLEIVRLYTHVDVVVQEKPGSLLAR